MNAAAVRANRKKLLILAALVLLCAAGYLLVEVNFSNPKLFAYAMKLRTPKLIVMLITAFAIGGASIVFQSIINNTIVTPCLLGMDRDAAIGTDGAQLAREIVENELVMGTDAYQNGSIVYLAHPAVWYTAEGGITALDLMLSDLETELLG